MAVAYLYLTNADETRQYDEMSQDLAEGPPEGLVLHVAGLTESGKMRIFEVWESDDARTRFAEQQLFPVFARHGFDPSTAPSPIRMGVHHMVGRSVVKA